MCFTNHGDIPVLVPQIAPFANVAPAGINYHVGKLKVINTVIPVMFYKSQYSTNDSIENR